LAIDHRRFRDSNRPIDDFRSPNSRSISQLTIGNVHLAVGWKNRLAKTIDARN